MIWKFIWVPRTAWVDVGSGKLCPSPALTEGDVFEEIGEDSRWILKHFSTNWLLHFLPGITWQSFDWRFLFFENFFCVSFHNEFYIYFLYTVIHEEGTCTHKRLVYINYLKLSQLQYKLLYLGFHLYFLFPLLIFFVCFNYWFVYWILNPSVQIIVNH